MGKLFRQGDANLQSFGQEGFDYVTTGTIDTYTYIAITALDKVTQTYSPSGKKGLICYYRNHRYVHLHCYYSIGGRNHYCYSGDW